MFNYYVLICKILVCCHHVTWHVCQSQVTDSPRGSYQGYRGSYQNRDRSIKLLPGQPQQVLYLQVCLCILCLFFNLNLNRNSTLVSTPSTPSSPPTPEKVQNRSFERGNAATATMMRREKVLTHFDQVTLTLTLTNSG